tara:strand:+ start:1237 stop:1725 length:489 start_codon:yes stop_codon:yes gene_type:complete
VNIPEEIISFLSEDISEPRLLDIGFELFEFPRAEELIEFQDGYRWEGKSRLRLSDWPENWIVIAHSNLDPLIYDTLSGSVKFGRHGAGSWSPNELFTDLNTMYECLLALSEIVSTAGDALFDDEFNILSKHVISMQNLLVELYGIEVGKKIEGAFEIKDWSA